MRTTFPFFATIVGVCDDSMRLPGSIWLGFGADGAVLRGDARLPVEVHHLVVEQEPGPLHHHREP